MYTQFIGSHIAFCFVGVCSLIRPNYSQMSFLVAGELPLARGNDCLSFFNSRLPAAFSQVFLWKVSLSARTKYVDCCHLWCLPVATAIFLGQKLSAKLATVILSGDLQAYTLFPTCTHLSSIFLAPGFVRLADASPWRRRLYYLALP